ncbi:MAG: alpha/beta hydrolase [Clostridia bacterium]|nr:alpha/beta hydrolase [Clostridia bacterium]
MSIPEIVSLALGCLVFACGLIIAIFFLIGFLTYRNLVIRKESVDKLATTPYAGALGPNLKEYNEFKEDAVKAFKVPYSWESITTEEGYRLFGRFVRNGESNKTVIFLHGYLTSAISDFAAFAPYYLKSGYNLLFVTSRGHAESGGRHISFGVKESRELLAWINKVNELIPDGEIVLHGYSIGANTALYAAPEAPKNVKVIIADSAYTMPWHVFVYQIKQIFKLQPFPELHVAEFFAKENAKFDFRKSAVKAVNESEIPVLFVHGARDMFVPATMGSVLYKESASTHKQLLIVEGAGHCQSYMRNPTAYEEALDKFIK